MGAGMNALTNYGNLLFSGSCVTLGAWLFAGTISMMLGTLLGIISCQQIGSRGMIGTIRVYTFITKGIPVYVQILLAYFVLPQLIGINLPAFFAATGALALCSSGYVTEIVRAQINAIPRGQWDACFVLGYSLPQTITRIIGELEQLLKSTSLLATIGVTELTRVGMNIISRELNPLPVYLTIAALYLLFSGILNCLVWLNNRKACS